MSASDFSMGAALSFAVRVPEAAPRSAMPTAVEVPADFADVLAKMAPDAASAAGEPAVQVAERWPPWREKLLQQGNAEPPAEDEGGLRAIPFAGDALPAERKPERASDTDKQIVDQAAAAASPLPARTDVAGIASAMAQPVPVDVAAPMVKANALPPADRQPALKLTAATERAPEETRAATAIDPVASRDAKPANEAKPAGEASERAPWTSLAVLGRETHMAPVRQPQLGQGIFASSPRDAEREQASWRAVADAPTSRPLPLPQPAHGALEPMLRETAAVAPIPQDAVGQDSETGDTEQPLPARATAASADGKASRLPPDQAASDGNPQPEQGSARSEDKPGKRLASAVEDPAAAATKDVARVSSPPHMPSQQIASRVVATAIAVQQEAQRVDGASVNVASAPVVKVLYLQLQPEDLGTITIRMSLKQDALDIRLEASSNDTAGLLQRDQETLAKLIASAGYRIEGMTVSAGGGDGAQLADGRPSGFSQSSMSGQSSSSQSDARSSGGRDGAPPDPRQFRGAQNGDGETNGTGHSAGGDLYV